ncbi:mitogen-activated protein kinase-binding protein 1-like [Uloborus diversus]|uniref:mitogen-activated protein kinase-binding protein 1-like n=1 Tax=Uloborus diversus TaxID=327109 RepID=UPI002409BB66|nr:mitogen-activated protein kinase-binding protein 1-like [Uloborus diversus]
MDGEDPTAAAKKVELQHVLGVTVTNSSALDNDPQTGTVAYPAGCVVVLYNTRKNKQRHLVSDAKRNITTLSFSYDGKYLATGECGVVSHVRVWDVQKLSQVADLSGHKHGINCVAFSPNMKYVVSIGSQHDMVVNVWDWRNKQKVASNKVSCKVKAISFSAGGNYFVTVGNNHVKFWYLEYSRSTKYKLEPVPLMGRSAILGDQRNNYFCDVACGRGESADSTFAVTKSGLLCEFNGRRLLDKWVELRIAMAYSVCVGENLILVGCSDGIVRCFSPLDLRFICTLPRPHYLGVDVSKGLTGRQVSCHPPASKYPDVIAVTLDETNKKVTCVHSDHSLYVWDVKDVKKVGKSHSFLYHSACIWGVETYPNLPESSPLPEGTFFTCASDDTIRIWNLDQKVFQNSALKRNIYCHELLKILYTDPNLVFLCDIDFLPAGTNEKLVNSYDGRNGVRCLKIRPDGQHLASGDRSGNVRIYDLQYLELLCKIEAHDAEVLCLEYSNLQSSDSTQLLSSASRDRLIHLFDAQKKYSFAQTLDDHTSSVTAAKFVRCDNDLFFVSCGADKSVIFRKTKWKPQVKVTTEQTLTEKTTFYDMEQDVSQSYVLAACQDSKIRIYDVPSGKYVRSMPGAQGDGTLIKLAMDPSGRYLATSSTDKTIYVYDYVSGLCVASMTGHSELVTGLKFMPSGKQLVSVSGDGCIFVWKLNIKTSQPVGKPGETTTIPNSSSIWQDSRNNSVSVTKPVPITHSSSDKAPYDFSDGQLPSWAKKQISEDWKPGGKSSPPPMQPRGRWAQRLEGQQLIVKSYSYTDSVIPIPQPTNDQKTAEATFMCSETESTNTLSITDETTLTKQVSVSRTVVQQQQQRVRHPTDSSSASSVRPDDGDAEDERSDSGATEVGEQLVYYPPEGNADFKDSSFHIYATKGEKRPVKSNKQSSVQRSMSSYCASDKTDGTDEDDSGTPGESELSYSNSFSMSTENLEKLGLRERFMLENFENMDHNNQDQPSHRSRYSISSKHHTTSNKDTRSNTLGRRTSTMSSKKREDLTRALNDARKKLETLGFKGGLSSSKSVGDLSNAGDITEVREKPRFTAKDSLIDMKRSTSYGDITSTNPPRRRLPYTPQPGGQSAPLWEQAKTIRFDDTPLSSDSPQSYKSSTPSRNVKLSASTTCLTTPTTTRPQSTTPFLPSESPNPLNKSMSSLTINVMSRNTSSGTRRLSLTGINRRPNYSDSSSSEASPTDTRSNTLVPRGIVARRMKAFCSEQLAKNISADGSVKKQRHKSEREPAKSKSEWDLRKLNEDICPSPVKEMESDPKFKEQSRVDYMEQLEASPNDLPVKDGTPSVASHYLDLNSTPLTKELCEKVSEDLKKVTSFAVQLFQRVTVDSQLTTAEKTSMTTTLAQGVWQAQQNLQPTAFGTRSSTADSQAEPRAAMMLLQQYSDKLLSLVEQRITKVEK